MFLYGVFTYFPFSDSCSSTGKGSGDSELSLLPLVTSSGHINQVSQGFYSNSRRCWQPRNRLALPTRICPKASVRIQISFLPWQRHKAQHREQGCGMVGNKGGEPCPATNYRVRNGTELGVARFAMVYVCPSFPFFQEEKGTRVHCRWRLRRCQRANTTHTRTTHAHTNTHTHARTRTRTRTRTHTHRDSRWWILTLDQIHKLNSISSFRGKLL